MSGPEIIAHMDRVDIMRLFYAALRSAHTTLAWRTPADDILALKAKLEEVLQASTDGGEVEYGQTCFDHVVRD